MVKTFYFLFSLTICSFIKYISQYNDGQPIEKWLHSKVKLVFYGYSSWIWIHIIRLWLAHSKFQMHKLALITHFFDFCFFCHWTKMISYNSVVIFIRILITFIESCYQCTFEKKKKFLPSIVKRIFKYLSEFFLFNVDTMTMEN